MLFSGSLICYLITAVVFSSEFPCSSLNFWYLHCALPWEAFSMTQVPVWQSTDRAMTAFWLLCMLALVHIRVGKNTWLNADFILLTLILRMSGGKISPCILKRSYKQAREWHCSCSLLHATLWKPLTTVVAFSYNDSAVTSHPSAEGMYLCVSPVGEIIALCKCVLWTFYGAVASHT